MDGGGMAVPQGKVILQYDETDWEFVRRVASLEGLAVVPSLLFSKPKIYIGNCSPAEGEEKGYSYEEQKNLRDATYIKMEISPYKIDKLLSLKIEQKVNEHARLYLLAIINEGEKDSPIYDTVDGSQIEILSPEAKDGIMFRGMVESVRVKQVKGVYQLEVQGISNSRKLDVKLKDRSFKPERGEAGDLEAGDEPVCFMGGGEYTGRR